MQRIPEPELMVDREQVLAYAMADFEGPHSRLLELFQEEFPEPLTGDVLDLGCGPGDISNRFARAYEGVRILGVDGSAEMLVLAGKLRQSDRIEFMQGFLPGAPIPDRPWTAIVSNSLLHHLHDPSGLWATIRQHGRPGTIVFVKDLMRPESEEQAEQFRERFVGDEPEVLQRDFYNSLLASFRPAEVEEQLRQAGLEGLKVRPVSERHLTISGRL